MREIKVIGANTSFRDFRNLNDLLLYMQKHQLDNNLNNDNKYLSCYGIMMQFLGFDMQPRNRNRNRNEVVVYFIEEDPLGLEERKLNMLWFDKTTKEVLKTLPEWFVEGKAKIAKSWN